MKTSIIAAAAAAAIAIAASGCATPPPAKPPMDYSSSATVQQATSKHHDQFKKTTNYTGPLIKSGNYFDFDSAMIRATKFEKTGSDLYQIYIVSHYYGAWRFYHSIDDANGNSLEFVSISRDVNCRSGCSYTEHVGGTVTRAYLEKYASTGITLQVSGKAGAAVYKIPAGYIQGFLAATAN